LKDKKKPGIPEFTLCVVRAAVEVLVARGVKEEDAVVLAREITESLAKKYGGSYFYIPKNVVIEAAKRAAMIFAEFDGSNYRDLAQKYNLTEVRVRQLIKMKREESREQKNRERQQQHEGSKDQ
jgi:Mor family transcriptional regulator